MAHRLTPTALLGLILEASLSFANAESLTIPHAMGTAELNAPAQRVVTLYQGANDAAVALGITPVGVVDSWVEQPMYHYLRDDLAGVTHAGLETQPNLEAIAALNPDVIISAKNAP